MKPFLKSAISFFCLLISISLIIGGCGRIWENVSYSNPNLCSNGYVAVVLQDNPMGFWMMNETSGTVATDLGTGGNNATYGAITLAQNGPFAGSFNYSVLNTSGTFDTADTGTANNLDLGGTNVFTMEFWAKTTDFAPGDDVTFGRANTLTSMGYVFGINSPSCVPTQFHIGKFGGAPPAICINGFVQDANWHFYAAVGNAVGIKIYVDGNLAGSSVDVQTFVACLGGTCANRLSSSGANPNWTAGHAIYSTALSQARIQAHYNAGITCH